MAQQAAIEELRKSTGAANSLSPAPLRKSISTPVGGRRVGSDDPATATAATTATTAAVGGDDEVVPCSAKLYFYFSQQDMMPWAEAAATHVTWTAAGTLDIVGTDDADANTWLLSFASSSERDEWLADLS